MAGRPIIALVSLILLAAGIVFEFFIILSGVVNVTPFNKSYFLSVASRSNLGTAPSKGLTGTFARVGWSYFSLVGIAGTGTNAPATAHGPIHAAFPFQPRTNFGTAQALDLPSQFQSGSKFYYISRVAWACFLIALFFAVVALFTGLLALCSRIGGFLSGFTTSIAAFFMVVAAALMTAWTVIGRNNFNSDNSAYQARLSRYGYGFTWAAFAAYFLAMILFCVSGAASGKKETTYKEKKGFFGRKQSTRSKDGIRSEYS